MFLDITSRKDKYITIGDDFNIDVLVDAPVQHVFFDLVGSFMLCLNVKIKVLTPV